MIDSKRAPYPGNGRREGTRLAQWETMNKKETHLGQHTPPHPTSRTSIPSSTWLDSNGGEKAAPGSGLGCSSRRTSGTPFADEVHPVWIRLVEERNPPRSSHHSADGREKWATSASVTAELEGGEGDGWFL